MERKAKAEQQIFLLTERRIHQVRQHRLSLEEIQLKTRKARLALNKKYQLPPSSPPSPFPHLRRPTPTDLIDLNKIGPALGLLIWGPWWSLAPPDQLP